jgi:uncharacterized membrane protein
MTDEGRCRDTPAPPFVVPRSARAMLALVSEDEGISARRRLLVSLAPGVAAGAAVEVATRQVPTAALGGWDVAALVFTVWTWRAVWRLDQGASARRAEREDPTQGVADLVLLTAAVVSLAAVGVVLVTRQDGKGAAMIAGLALAAVSVIASWTVVHTVYALKYARLYYLGRDGGIDFHGDHPPTYQDFAYLAFTVGMTFQVSDTEINARVIRATVLRHALLAYLFGAVILAATINLLAGLSQ